MLMSIILSKLVGFVFMCENLVSLRNGLKSLISEGWPLFHSLSAKMCKSPLLFHNAYEQNKKSNQASYSSLRN